MDNTNDTFFFQTKDPFIIITITTVERRIFQITLARATVRMLYNANQRVPYIAVIETNASTRTKMRLLLSTAKSAQMALRQDKRKKKSISSFSRPCSLVI